MNLTRRSFLRSLGAALLTPLLPKVKPVPEVDDLGGFVVPEELAGVPLPTEPTRIGPYVIGVDFGGQDWSGIAVLPPGRYDWLPVQTEWGKLVEQMAEAQAGPPYPDYLWASDPAKWCSARLEDVAWTGAT